MPQGGLGSRSREKLAAVLRDTQGTISPSQAARALKLSNPRAAQLLAFWASRGWLSRVQRGLYVPIRLESKASEGSPCEIRRILTSGSCPTHLRRLPSGFTTLRVSKCRVKRIGSRFSTIREERGAGHARQNRIAVQEIAQPLGYGKYPLP